MPGTPGERNDPIVSFPAKIREHYFCLSPALSGSVQTLAAFELDHPRRKGFCWTGRLIVVVAAPLAAPAFLADRCACGMAQVIE